MQAEMAKMCDVITDLTKTKKRSHSKKNCSKRQRIAKLEKEIKELQAQLLNAGKANVYQPMDTQISV